MIRYLLTEKNKHKGNLHCHTTLSDGSMTPQEIADAYREHGYDFVALSDHDHYYAHPELQRDDFLVLYAYEQGIDSPTREPFGPGKCYHFNFFAKSPDQKAPIIPQKPDYYDKDALNDFIKAIKDQGFLCSYNHPYWSLQNFEDYTPLKHIDFLEIFNYGCYIGDGLHENQVNVYDDMLLQFPPCELKTKERFTELFKTGVYKLFLCSFGYMLILEENITNTIWLDYFAVYKKFHSQGKAVRCCVR